MNREDLEAIREVVEHAIEHAHPSPWLTAEEAADYLRCSLSRIRKLTMMRDLQCERDGRRVLYHREALDAYVRSGGVRTP